MRSRLSSFIAALAMVVGLASAPVANAAVVFDTALATTASNLTLSLYLGDPNAGGSLLTALGPLGMTGTANGDVALDPSNTGTLDVSSSALVLDDFGPSTIVIPIFGTVDATINGVTVDISASSVPVTTGAFTIDSSTVGSLALNSGTATLDNATGVLASLLPTGSTIDFSTDPLTVAFSSLGASTIPGTLVYDSGTDTYQLVLSLSTAVPITDLAPGVTVYGLLTGTIGLGASAVPEVGSMMLMGIAVAGAGVVGLVRRNRKS